MPLRVLPRKIETLSEDPANTNTHSERSIEAIAASLQRFGQQKPIVVDPAGVVRAGNGTFAAAKLLGWDTIETVTTALSATELAAYAIADNRTAELSDRDEDALRKTLEALAVDDETLLDALGYNEQELEVLMLVDGTTAAELEEDSEKTDEASTDFVQFSFGSYKAQLSPAVYASFVTAVEAKRDAEGNVMLDDVVREWLGL